MRLSILRVAIAAAFAAVVGGMLGGTVPDVLDRAINSGLSGSPVGVEVPFASTTGEESIREIFLRVRDAAAFERADQIQLQFGTYGTRPFLRYAWLQVSGSPCSFQAAEQTLADNGRLIFTRVGQCDKTRGSGEVRLRLAMSGPARYARAALWTFASPAGEPGQLSVAAYGQVLDVAGRTVVIRPGAPVRRIVLLAFMWDLPVWALVISLMIAAALVVTGATLLPGESVASAAGASFAISAGLALSYAVIVPPLQAPDEPDHLLSFAVLTERPQLAADTSTWAKRIHFDRITFTGDERFTPADRERPFDRDWPPSDVFAENVRRRSSTATREWQVLSPIVPTAPAHALLFFRCAGAIVFGAGIAAVAGLAAGATAPSALLAITLLIVPTLPFFAMQVSELTFTLTAFLVIVAAALRLRRSDGGYVPGLLLGVALALLAGGSRNGWPSVMLVASLAGARMVLGGMLETSARSRVMFWGAVALPGVVVFSTRLLWIPSPFFEQWTLTGLDPRVGATSGMFIVALAGAACIGWTAEWLLTTLRASRALAPLAKAACGLAAAIVAGTLVYSLVRPLPGLSTIELSPPPDAQTYVWWVLSPIGTFARLRSIDFLTWTSFWGAYGWAGTVLPSLGIVGLTALVSFAAIRSLVAAARSADPVPAIVTLLALAGIAAAGAVIAISSYGLHRNVHGRYLIGPYLLALALLAGPALAQFPVRLSSGARASALLGLIAAVHGFALRFLLGNYFG